MVTTINKTTIYTDGWLVVLVPLRELLSLGVLLHSGIIIGYYSSAIAGATWYALIRLILPTTDLRLLAACIDASNSLRFIVTFTTPTSTS